MTGVLALMSITPTYGVLRMSECISTPISSPRLMRTICTYKWELAKNYLKSHPNKVAIQAGYHMSKWEWWVVRSDFGFLQCTLFNGQIMIVAPLLDSDDEDEYVYSSDIPIISVT